MKMVPKAKQPLAPKAEAKAKKAVLKGTHNLRKNICMSPTFWRPKTLWLQRQPKYPQNSAPRKNKPDHYTIIKPPDYPVSHEEDRRQQYTCVHCGCQGQPAPGQTVCEEARDTDVAKVNT